MSAAGAILLAVKIYVVTLAVLVGLCLARFLFGLLRAGHDKWNQDHGRPVVYGDGYRRDGVHVMVGTPRPLASNFAPSGREAEDDLSLN